MSNANVPPPSFLSSCRVLLRCPLCYGAFRTHLQFMNHIRTTHLLTSERNTILCSHAYASNILSPENPLGSQLAAPQHTSSQNVIRHSSGYPSGTLLRENMLSAQSTTPQRVSPQNVNLRPPLYSFGSLLQGNLSSVQHAAPQHANLQNVIQRSPLYGSGNFFTGNMSSPQPAAPHHATSQGNNNVVITPTLSLNRNNPTRISDRAPPINWQQMASRNRVGGSNSTFPNSNDSTIDCTRSLTNQLNVPVPTNVDQLANIADEQNDVDLTLRL
ncbi:hypothetical protein EJD97_004967 [Solanum chilense]|uniref:C2H2-type domain-containing protein n=1 Tax=Solanum chilense TaxID=4083 RepID=A0A6N2ASB6_SOLCI|nr:hypothetical protein EJD97_004967 [Solanum chilense]